MAKYNVGQFSAEELRRSIIFDAAREVSGEAGGRLLAHFMDETAARESRQRALTAKAANVRRATFSAFFANLAVAAFNRVNDEKFVAVSFNRNWYSRGKAYENLSLPSAVLLRNYLLENGLVEGAAGIGRFDYMGEYLGMLTRLRATDALLDLFMHFGLEPRSIRSPQREIIIQTKPDKNAGPEPQEVTSSRSVLDRLNERLAVSEIALPYEYWGEVRKWRAGKEPGDEDQKHWQFAGDLTAVSLFRSFTGLWEQGGRLYGGWWQNVPSSIRPFITIDGDAVCELDFSQLHPSILYARLGRKPEIDIYAVDQQDRELGKNTFMRLLNGKTVDLKKEGKDLKVTDMSFSDYLTKILQNVAPIKQWMGIQEGLRLQREDSDLAMAILEVLAQRDVVALPVHDSFIVKQRNRETLHTAMRDCFIARFGTEPEIHG